MNYIVHYYWKGSVPFRSITGLSDQEASHIADELKKSNLPVFRRFEWSEYLSERRKTEQWLKTEFSKLGGIPKTDAPLYFTLGESPYYKSRYEDDAVSVSIPLDTIPEEDISFTIPDSMASRLLKEYPDSKFQPEYHGVVFTRTGLIDFMGKQQSLMPNECLNNEESNKFFIEAQLWNEEYIQQYRHSA